MRLPYLPAVLPDELLYSVLARFHRHIGSGGPGGTMRSLFGRATVVASLDLPNRLLALAARIDPARGITADWLIDHATLFPYYTAFATPAVIGAVRTAMLDNGNSVHVRLGVAAMRHLPCIMKEGECGEWLREITRSKNKAHHPLFHAVLRVFLASMEAKASPYGVAPWPCRNLLAGHFGQPTIMSSRRHRNHKTMVPVFECGCGYVYTRCLYPDGRVGPPRYQSYGPLLEAALRRAVVPGSSLRFIARSVALDPKTLLRELTSLGIPSPWACRALGRARSRPRRTAVGPTNRAVRTASRPRVDWVTLDAKLVARLRMIADAIRAVSPPVRVTLAELERRLGRRGWIRKRRAKLPLSNRETDALAEPLADFRHRRIAWVLEEALRTGTPVITWRVMRAAGLPHGYLPMIEEVIAATAHVTRR